MAAAGEPGPGRLTPRHVGRLAHAMSRANLESLAAGYLGVTPETLESLRDKHRENVEGFNREVLHNWANMNSGPDQLKVRLIER